MFSLIMLTAVSTAVIAFISACVQAALSRSNDPKPRRMKL